MSATTTPGAFGRWLARKPVALTVVATLAAFGAYTSMYAFRKPFTAASFSGQKLAGFDLKVLLVVAQMVGYTLSKFTGVKVVSEAQPGRRVGLIALLIAVAFAPLALLPFVSPPLQVGCLLVNGLPLGMIWGLVFSFLEGRRVTEFLGLGLSVSFIFASGWTKSVGQLVMTRWGVTELAMPAVTGLLFVPLLAICLWALAQLPAPDAADVADRSVRQPMDAVARRNFLRGFFLPIALLVLGYVLLTVYRDLRDSFMTEVLKELGQKVQPSVFARVETFAGLGVMLALGGLWFIRDHWRALGVYHLIIVAGAALVGGATLLFQAGLLSPVWWISLTGLGVYLGYVPFNSILFDRLLAATRQVGTASFLISVADAAGYAMTMLLYLARLGFGGQISWSRLTILMSFALAVFCPLLLLASWIGLRQRQKSAR
jgi:Family of unknown function (DUF5690)